MNNELSQLIEFDVVHPDLENGRIIEASAGSGKTFSVAGMVAHEIATNSDLRISEILVTTFTRNAAAELRDRIRRRLVSLEESLRSGVADDKDALAQSLIAGDRLAMADRLVRAIREFDSATIATIHSICSRVMAMAGLSVSGEGRANSEIEQLISGVINDEVVAAVREADEKFLSLDIKQYVGRLTQVVKEALGSPLSKLAIDGDVNDVDDAISDGLAFKTRLIVNRCVNRIRHLTEDDPTFDDLLFRTAQLLGPNGDAAVARAFRERFSLAIIDEAQDTDKLQWKIFQAAFNADETSRKLIAVGDPKQAIYRFRGADVEAYIAQRDDAKTRSLSRNWRSDENLVDAMNVIFNGKSFGNGINYVTVRARDGAPQSSIAGYPSMTVVNIGQSGNAPSVVKPAALRVREILEEIKIVDENQVSRAVVPKDVCVLVNSKRTGRAVESELRDWGIPAVSSGTESVMSGAMASEIERLFSAMELSGNESRVRLAAATVFFGADLLHVGSISDGELEEISRTLFTWSGILRRHGVSSFSSRLRQDKNILSRIISGSGGERRETDYVHIIELLHAETGGKGCSPEDVLAAFTRLSAFDDMSETVSRRIESDRDAVQIMTVHASKGLEFPIVVVADLWKMERKGGKPPVPVFHHTSSEEDGLKERMIDVGWVVNEPFVLGKTIMDSEEGAEKKRLFYVAMTRAEHHVSLIYASKGPKDKVARVTDGLLEDIANSPDSSSIEVRMLRSGAGLGKYQHNVDLVSDLSTAELSNSVIQTYQRQSFSGLTKNHRGEQQLSVDSQETSRGGDGDDDQIIAVRTGYAAEDIPETLGNIPMPLARLTGGTYFGKVLHRVYELLDFSADDLRSEVQRVVDAVVVGALSSEREKLIEGIALSLETPLNGVVGEISLKDIGPKDRLAELNFEMRTAELAHEVKVSDIGRVLRKSLMSAGRSDDILLPYAKNLEENFSSQIVGLMNGSIDALLRIHGESGSRYFITDFKSNRIDSDGDDLVISGYTRERMMEEMAHHDYPLQALIYGVGVYRYLRWCQPEVDADQSVVGFCYLFIRAMIGQQTPVADSHRHGVFTWEAPPGLWAELSLLFSGVKS